MNGGLKPYSAIFDDRQSENKFSAATIYVGHFLKLFGISRMPTQVGDRLFQTFPMRYELEIEDTALLEWYVGILSIRP